MSTTTLATTVLGSSRLLESGRLRGKRVGIVANPASIDQQFVHVVDRLVRADGVTLGAIFGPQHGFNADLQENMIETPHAESRAHRVKVYSLYSETREPTPAMLDGLDVLVVDLQDVGTRIYTFIYTMAYCLTGAAQGRDSGDRVRSAQPDRRRRRSKGRCSSGASSRSSGSTPSRCGTG